MDKYKRENSCRGMYTYTSDIKLLNDSDRMTPTPAKFMPRQRDRATLCYQTHWWRN